MINTWNRQVPAGPLPRMDRAPASGTRLRKISCWREPVVGGSSPLGPATPDSRTWKLVDRYCVMVTVCGFWCGAAGI